MYIPVYNTAQPHRSPAHHSMALPFIFIISFSATRPGKRALAAAGFAVGRFGIPDERFFVFTDYYYTEIVFTSIQKQKREGMCARKREEREREGRGDEAA